MARITKKDLEKQVEELNAQITIDAGTNASIAKQGAAEKVLRVSVQRQMIYLQQQRNQALDALAVTQAALDEIRSQMQSELAAKQEA